MGFTHLMPLSGSGSAANHGHSFCSGAEIPCILQHLPITPWACNSCALVGSLHRVSLIPALSHCWAAAWETLAGRIGAVPHLPAPGQPEQMLLHRNKRLNILISISHMLKVKRAACFHSLSLFFFLYANELEVY